MTCLFNPAGVRIRKQNFELFRSRLCLPLIVAELAFDCNPFELAHGDAEIVLQVRQGDRMWQKEALLNLAITKLPPEVEKILVIDSDVLLPQDDAYLPQLERMLDDKVAIQPFSTVRHINAPPHTPDTPSTVGAASTEGFEQVFGRTTRRGLAPCSGYVWGIQRPVIERHGLYPFCIVGGGDSALVAAATGYPGALESLHSLGEAQLRRYLGWAEPFREEVAGRVGFMEAQIGHLWHGTWGGRKGRERHLILREHDFDPDVDIARTEEGLWRWSSEKPALHQAVADYFVARCEDGDCSTVRV